MIDYCAQCGEPVGDNSGKCDEFPKCESLGMDEWRAKVHGHAATED